MARIALIKLFTGLNLGMCQLSGELQRAGHESLMVYFKQFRHVPRDSTEDWKLCEHTLPQVGARAREYYWTAYQATTDAELRLLLETLQEFRPDVIGFSLCSVPLREAGELTRFLKQHFDVPIVWGGAGPTIEPEKSLEAADFVCVGEGEQVILEIADRIDAGQQDLRGIGNLWSSDAGEPKPAPKRPLVDLETIAIPDYDPRRTVHINDDQVLRNRYPVELAQHYHVMTQRGCPFSCSFCIESKYQEMWGKKGSLRRRSVDLVIDELVWAKKKYELKAVMIFDDVFTVNRDWLADFAPKYREAVGLPFWAYTYPTSTRLDDLQMLQAAGMRAVTMGIQSGSSELLGDYNRPVRQDRAIRAARDIVAAGIDGFFDLITGSDLETEEDCRKTFEFLLEFPREMQVLNMPYMVSYPGYAYERVAQSKPDVKRPSADDYAYYHRLYLLTRTALPEADIRAIANAEIVRKYPQMIDALLPDRLPFHMIPEGSIDLNAFKEGTPPLPADRAGPPPDHATERIRPRPPAPKPKRPTTPSRRVLPVA